MEIANYLQNEGKFLAKKFLRGLELNNIIVSVKKISNSGMSRRVCFYVAVQCEDGTIDLRCLDYFISQVLNLKLGKNANGDMEGVVLKGCGYNVVAYCLERLLEAIIENSDMEYLGSKDNVYRFHTI